MPNMRVTEETPTKLVLEMVPETISNWVHFRNPLITALLFLVGSVLFLVLVPDTSLHWLFWIIAIGSLLFAAFILFLILNDTQEAIVTIDLISKRATRSEKKLIGKEKHYELALEQVSNVVVNFEEVGKSGWVILESQNNISLEVNYAGLFELESLKAFGIKVGKFLEKPVLLRITEVGELASEEVILPL